MRQRRLTAMGASIVMVALMGCADDDSAGDPPRAETPPTVLADLTDDPDATAAVLAGLEALRLGNSGTFTTRLKYADTTYDYHGSYRLTPAQQRVSMTADLADRPVSAKAVGDGDRFYVRLPPDGPASSKCWVSGDPQQIADATGVETNPDFNRLPGAISVASTAVGVAFVEGFDDVHRSVDLATAMALVSPRLPALLGIVGGQARVLARFTFDGRALSGVAVTGSAILAALDEVGTEADPQELEAVFGADTPVEVTLSDSGATVVIEPPAPAAVIDLAAPDAQARLDSCE